MDGNLSITKLEGSTNWNVWKFQVRVVLRGHDLLDVVEGKLVKTKENDKTWDTKDAKAQTLIVTRISDEVMIHILSCSTSAEMWKKLIAVYEQKSETNIHIIQQRFFQFKYEEGIQMSIFLAKIKEMQNQLQQLGEEISERFVITKVLMSLPDRYKHFVSAWESAPDEKQTYDNLVARLLVEEERMKERGDETPTASAFVVKKTVNKKNVKCFNCNKLGHYQSECRNKVKNSDTANRFGKKCFYCNKSGHLKSECRFRLNKDSNAFVMLEVADNLDIQYMHSKWVVDTGASEHMCRDKQLFTSYSSLDKKSVIVGNGTAISALGFGQVAAQVFDGHVWIDTTLEKVLFVPELKTNLLSVNRVTEKGYVMKTNQNKCDFYKNERLCAVANRCGNIYIMDLRLKCSAANTAQVRLNLSEWHEKLAHQNIQHVKKVLANNNIEANDDFGGQCQGCLEGKAHRLPFKMSQSSTSRTCELIHADVCGPMEETSIGGSRYFLLLKDDFSNYRSVYFLKGKHEVKTYVEKYIKLSENITGNKIMYFRSDNGSEFVNKDMKSLLSHHGILHQTSVTYTPEQNGKAERENRTLVEAARSLLYAKRFPKKLWAEATNTACYVLNRTGLSSDKVKTPYEAWMGKRFDIQDLKIFGTPVFVHTPHEKRAKWDSKGEHGIMVGYGEETKGYRIYFEKTNIVQIKRDVQFLEGKIYKDLKIKQESCATDCQPQLTSKEMDSVSTNKNNNIDPLPVTDSTDFNNSDTSTSDCGDDPNDVTWNPDMTVDQSSSDYDDTEENINIVVAMTAINGLEPQTIAEALSEADKDQWREAIEDEYKSFEKNKAWTLTLLPAGKKAVKCKWIFKKKLGLDGQLLRYKARLVAKGFTQEYGIDYKETYSPVVRYSTIRTLIALAVNLDLNIDHMDVKTAFLNGELQETVYMEQPDGYKIDGKENHVFKLNKAIYGLKQASKAWYDKIDNALKDLQFRKTLSEPCVYIKSENSGNITILALYVDDILIFSKDISEKKKLKEELMKRFEMKDLGRATHVLGMRLRQEQNKITLDQKNYIQKVLEQFNMVDCKPVNTPLECGMKLERGDQTDADSKYRSLVGCIMYIAVCTRPDIAHAASLLSQFNNCHSNIHWKAAKRVLRYLKGTMDYNIVYQKSSLEVTGYVDADWASNQLDRRSYTGYVFTIGNSAVSWESRKQRTVALSSTEAEYMALCEGAKEAKFIRNFLYECLNQYLSVTLYNDSQSAQKICNSQINHSRSKHIDIRHHYVRQIVNDKIVTLEYLPTEQMVADVLTKCLSKDKHCNCVSHLGLQIV